MATTLFAEDDLVEALRTITDDLGVRVSDRLAAAHDASHYLMTPDVVVRPSTLEQVAALLTVARDHRLPVTFRSGGTSLSGQSVCEGMLVDTRRHFRSIEILDDGARVRCGPGTVMRAVNAALARFGRKLGPDPASEIACTVGGVVANNSSGMACGIEKNTYRTLDSLVLVLPAGTIVDTGRPDADEKLRGVEPELHRGLGELRDRLRGDASLVERITELHSIKNTMGYGLNSFLDHDEPVRILEHLAVGSEGTLGFIAEATFRTVPVRPYAATGLLVFSDLTAATSVLSEVVATGAETVELMDATSLRVAQRDRSCPAEVAEIDVDEHCALLVEFQEEDEEALADRVAAAEKVWAGFTLDRPVDFTRDRGRRAALWQVRKGLFTSISGNRRSGTTALLEDVAVPVDRLGETCLALTELFDTHGYTDAVIFGHAKDGNVHFMITEEFGAGGDAGSGDLDRYAAFTEDLVDLILDRGGTLKAEHGTGRIMAPFVRRQVGDELHSVMKQVKALVDPDSLLNPGVVLTDDERAHLKNLKTTPTVEEEVDRCVECGYCEPVCPSRDITTTPRERIVLRREMARAEEAGDDALVRELREEYEYDGIETCAADGMCQTACPVSINTGDLIRRLRAEEVSRPEGRMWARAADHWELATKTGRTALSVANRVPSLLPEAATALARGLVGDESVPKYTPDLPAGGQERTEIAAGAAQIVWFSSCTNTMFGPAGDHAGGVAQAFLELCASAGVRIRTPEGIGGLCCGTPWKSKGYLDGHEVMRRRVVDSLSGIDGELTVVCDASSCTEGLRVLLGSGDADSTGTLRHSHLGGRDVRVIDSVTFAAETLLPALRARGALPEQPHVGSLVLHPTCSSTQLGLAEAFQTVAEAVADPVITPLNWGCCAFAGDRGMLHPELTASATAAEAAEVRAIGDSEHASTNRTCEIGMTRATGRPYRHILEILAEAVESGGQRQPGGSVQESR